MNFFRFQSKSSMAECWMGTNKTVALLTKMSKHFWARKDINQTTLLITYIICAWKCFTFFRGALPRTRARAESTGRRRKRRGAKSIDGNDNVRSNSARASETIKRVFEKTGKRRVRGVSVAFTEMGEYEPRGFHMYELLWNPQKFRSAHFEGTIDAVG